jgi:hypothetical protein
MGEWGTNAEIYTAIFTGLLFLATGALAAIAWVEISSARDENRQTQTLLACGRYDTDPIIFACHKRLVEAKNFELKNDEALLAKAVSLRLEIITVLNFLDAIAIGVRQRLYIKNLVRDHLSPIIRRHVAELIDSGVLEALETSRDCFKMLIALDQEWNPDVEIWPNVHPTV